MVIYAGVLFAIQLLALGMALGKDDGRMVGRTLLSISLYLPVFGRIFGWW